MALLAASALAIFVGVAIFGLIVARLWMKLVWRVVMVMLTLGALGAVGAVAWLWVAR
jgi:hypothetical protein